MIKVDDPIGYTRENMHEHYLTIIDNMVSDDLKGSAEPILLSIGLKANCLDR